MPALRFSPPLVAALAAALLACEPAAPLPATDAGAFVPADEGPGGPDPDMAPRCPDADEDGAHLAECAEPGQLVDCDDGDPLVRPGASDPCGDGIDQDCDGADTPCPEGCMPNVAVEPCDDVDDDCDGVFEECSGGQVCEDAMCVALPGAPCGDACARGSACVDDVCQPIAPGGLCLTEGDCPNHAFCELNDICDPAARRCYALQGVACEGSCDCGDTWVCGERAGVCTRCQLDAQCDGGAVCTGAGLCALPTALDGEALDGLLRVLLDCAERFDGVPHAEGCARLDTGALLADGASIGALEPPPAGDARVCDGAALTQRGFDEAQSATIGALFGCGSEPLLDWAAPLAAEREAAACVTHLPPWARPDGLAGMAIAPCGMVVYARDP